MNTKSSTELALELQEAIDSLVNEPPNESVLEDETNS